MTDEALQNLETREAELWAKIKALRTQCDELSRPWSEARNAIAKEKQRREIIAEFTNTEASWSVTLPPKDEAGESPKGLGRDGNKPLMRNRTANEEPSPIGNAGGNNFHQ